MNSKAARAGCGITFLLLASCLVGWTQTTAMMPGSNLQFTAHPETTFQTIVGFGAGFNDNSGGYFEAISKPGDLERAYDLLFGEQKGVRLNIMRLKISPDAKPSDSSGRHYNWAADQRTQLVWQAIKSVLPWRLRVQKPILYAVPFTPPAGWKTYSPQLCASAGCLMAEHYLDYAEYLADFLEYYDKVLRTHIDVLSLQNEPGIAPLFWEGCIWNGEQMRKFLPMVAKAVQARGLSVQFMSSEGTAWIGAWDHLRPTLDDPGTRRHLGIMASHSYGDPEDRARKFFAEASTRYQLPVWVSEMSLMPPMYKGGDDKSMRAGLTIARYIHRDMVEAQASAWIYCFAIFTSKINGQPVPGSMGVLSPPDGHGALVVPKRFWTMANYSYFVRPGWKLMQIDGKGANSTGFVSPSGNSFVIVAINEGLRPQQATYQVDGHMIGTVQAFATTAELDLAPVDAPLKAGDRFTAVLAPESVTTFVVTSMSPAMRR